MVRKFLLLGFCLILFCSPLHAQQPQDSTVQLMEQFTNAFGPPGFEDDVRQLFEREMRTRGAEVSTDGLGSVIARVAGSADRPRIMVDAHLDELGLMVRYITPDGFVKVQTLGWWLVPSLFNQHWTIKTEKGLVPAVSGFLDAHIASADDAKAFAAELKNVSLDVGARSREDAEAMGIRPGDPIVPSTAFTTLANNRYAAKAWDDRIGLMILVEALNRLKKEGATTPNALYLTGTVQEEIGLRGATTTANTIKPDLGIALEVGIAADYPGSTPDQAEERLGLGPAVFAYDNSVLPNVKLREFFRLVAREKNIPLQTDLVVGYGEDAAVMQRYGTGTPVINFVVPTRYTHTATGVIDRRDFDQAVDLLVEVLKRLDAKTVAEIAHFD
ncbi:MAG TPA: M42 family metallopeptidase [Terriglobia bacterium]|nr:M42 family metallopeptidase [Terriglobia bacterium]